MRSALSALTTRGRCLLAAGIAAGLCALLLGERDLLRAAIFLMALPLVAAAVVARTRFRLTCTRALMPARVPAGQPAEVVLSLRNASMLPTGLLMLEDDLPYSLGGRPRFMVDRVSAGETRIVRYPVRSDARGKYRIGPLRLRLADPFGLVELVRSFSAVDRLTVTPMVHWMPESQLGGIYDSGGDSVSRAIFSRGEDDAATREYRHGDDLRKVHWRSTARVGKLMVRQVEKPWQSRATLLLDTRGNAHRGDGPGASFEWAVSAVASIGTHLSRLGYSLHLLTEKGRIHSEGVDFSEQAILLDYLAEVTPSRSRGFEGGIHELRGEGQGTFIAVLGSLGVDEARALVSARPVQDINIALMLDTATWVHLSPRAQQDAADSQEAAAHVLARNGWRVVRVAHGSSMADMWARAGQRTSGDMARSATRAGTS